MKIIFMGTPEFAIPSLDAIHKKYGVEAIFTKVDKPNTRGGKIKYTPVKEFALEHNIKLFQPETLRSEEIVNAIKEINPDLIIVVAYGKIIPNDIIDIPKYGIINVHSSLLPKFRGAAPINAAIVAGEKETGATIMKVVEKLDAGDMIHKVRTPIFEEDNFLTLHDRLKELGAQGLVEAVGKIFDGTATYEKQNEAEVTFVKPYKKEDCLINWSDTAKNIYNFVRGMTPFPGTHTHLEDKLIKVVEVKKYERQYDGVAGQIVDAVKNEGFVVKVGDSSIILSKIKLENKGMITGQDSINGKHLKIGDVLK